MSLVTKLLEFTEPEKIHAVYGNQRAGETKVLEPVAPNKENISECCGVPGHIPERNSIQWLIFMHQL